MKTLHIIGEIDTTLYATFIAELEQLQLGAKEVLRVEITSEGGDPDISLAIFDRLTTLPNVVHTYGYGVVNSAAVLIFAAGDRRYSGYNTWFLFHRSRAKESGDFEMLASKAKQLKTEETQWCSLLEQQTGTLASAWHTFSEGSVTLSAEAAELYNLVTDILPTKKRSK